MQAICNSSEYNLNTIKYCFCIVQWVLKPPCVWGLMQNRDSLSWQWSAQSRHSKWSQLANHVISSWLVTIIHEILEFQMIRFTNSETLLYLNSQTAYVQKKSPWRGSSSCDQGHIQSRAQTGVRPTGAWNTTLLAVTQDAYLQQNLFISPCFTLSELVFPTVKLF